jgi:hypothetical protein
MAALQNVDRISFCVDTLIVKNGRKLGRIRPDESGYYKMPIAVLGTVTDNFTYYEVEDFVAQLTSPTSFINRVLVDGKCYGEYGHPMIRLLPENQQIPRLMVIDEKCQSHHIKAVTTGEKLESGGRLLYGLLKPAGPYGEYLQASLDDPCQNTSFSLRSIAQSRNENGITRRKIKQLVTFDYVCAGGYNEASKRYTPGVESIAIELTPQSVDLAVITTAMESLSNTEINELFGAKVVTIGTQRTTFVNKEAALRDANGCLRSVYTSLLSAAL